MPDIAEARVARGMSEAMSSAAAAKDEVPSVDLAVPVATWIRSSPARELFRKRYALPIMVALYERADASTSGLIRAVGGHPATVIGTLRVLEAVGVLRRLRQPSLHHEVRARLTLRGLELVETPLYRWERLIRKWDELIDRIP